MSIIGIKLLHISDTLIPLKKFLLPRPTQR